MSRHPAAGRQGSALGHGDLEASLVLIVPLLLVYEIGVLFSSTLNGVDLVTHTVSALVGGDRTRYLLVHVAFAVAYLCWVRARGRARTLSVDVIVPVVLEAMLYALTLGTVIHLIMDRVLGMDLGAGLSLGHTGEAVVMSLGAGVHEELVFRLGLLAGGTAVLGHMGLSPRWALVVALVASSLAFSAAHHVGPWGEPWTTDVFVYRALAGAAFGLIFWHRSLAHAVYAHALYDVYVLALRT